MNGERDIRPLDRGTADERRARARDVAAEIDREVVRRATQEERRQPLPPPVTSALEEGASEEVVIVTATVGLPVTDPHAEAALARQRTDAAARARLNPDGFLDAHGANGPGWLVAQGAQSPGFLATHGADGPGWLASLEARRNAARASGWYTEPRGRTR